VLGVGLNYTTFFSEDTRGALDGTSLKLGDSWGLAAQPAWTSGSARRRAIRVDVRWIDIDTKVKLNGANLGTRNTVNIDPSVYGIAYVFAL
jgi:outer membrane protein